jgi:hypothetical protein
MIFGPEEEKRSSDEKSDTEENEIIYSDRIS